jgi:hypothetical protein
LIRDGDAGRVSHIEVGRTTILLRVLNARGQTVAPESVDAMSVAFDQVYAACT